MDTRSFFGTSRVHGAHPDIFPGSTQAVIGLFIQSLRIRFTPIGPNPLPWVYKADPTPEADETGDVDGPRRLYIGEAWDPFPQGRDVLPALLVGRNTVQYQKLGLGHRVDAIMPTREETFVAHASMPIYVLCESGTPGESAQLADHVAFFLLASAPLLRSKFAIQDIGLPVITETASARRGPNDLQRWSTQVAINVDVKVIWKTKAMAAVLQELAVNTEFTR